eukprot:1232856-Rhodomonas_salina.2
MVRILHRSLCPPSYAFASALTRCTHAGGVGYIVVWGQKGQCRLLVRRTGQRRGAAAVARRARHHGLVGQQTFSAIIATRS